MNEHRTEQQLIDYAFNLADEAATQQTRAHLDQCEACRGKLDQLKGKFAALDLLRGRIEVSEDLLAQTIKAATKARPTGILPFQRTSWLTLTAATAAVLMLGVSLFMFSTFGPPPPPQSQSSIRQTYGVDLAKTKTEAKRPDDPALAFAEEEGAGSALAPTDAAKLAAVAPAESLMAVSAPMPGQVLDGDIDDKPPFAPASAIELVVLPRRQDVQLTIYNSADLTLVRERRNLTLKKGWNWLQFMWAQTLIDPTSMTLEPLEHKDRVEIQQLVFPPRLRELGRWLIRSEVSGQVPFELTYLTSGLAWRSFYMGTLSADETTMNLQAYVRVDNQSGEDYENAQTRLIVGKVHLLDQIRTLAQRQYAYGSPLPMGPKGGPFLGAAFNEDRDDRSSLIADEEADKLDLLMSRLERKDIRKEGLSEYFLYTIEGTETIPNQWAKRLLSFETENIPVTSLYKYDEQRWGPNPIRFVSFANDTEHELGETPLPNGAVRIFGRADTQGHLSYTGAADVKYIPVGEEIELNLGPARLVKVEPVLMSFRTENYTFDNNDNIQGWDEVRTWNIEIANARTLPVDIEITRAFTTQHWELKSPDQGVTYEKHDVTRARFKLTVQPRTKRTFTYTVTTYHGARERVLIERQQNQTR
jgi:hypothetical protein